MKNLKIKTFTILYLNFGLACAYSFKYSQRFPSGALPAKIAGSLLTFLDKAFSRRYITPLSLHLPRNLENGHVLIQKIFGGRYLSHQSTTPGTQPKPNRFL